MQKEYEESKYYLEPGSAYGPEEPVWNYTSNPQTSFYDPKMSGAQRLPNGNTLICCGTEATFFEVTNEKEVVWRYFNRFPLPWLNLNYVFKTQTYSSDYPGLQNLKQS